MMPLYPISWRSLFEKRPPQPIDRMPPPEHDPMHTHKAELRYKHIRERYDAEFRKFNEKLEEIRKRRMDCDDI
jgi:hypothetical protein